MKPVLEQKPCGCERKMGPAKEVRHQYWSTGGSSFCENLKEEGEISNKQEKGPRNYTDQEALVWRAGQKVIRLEVGWHMEGGGDCRGRIFELMG